MLNHVDGPPASKDPQGVGRVGFVKFCHLAWNPEEPRLDPGMEESVEGMGKTGG